jgi:hypothetical protein
VVRTGPALARWGRAHAVGLLPDDVTLGRGLPGRDLRYQEVGDLRCDRIVLVSDQ